MDGSRRTCSFNPDGNAHGQVKGNPEEVVADPHGRGGGSGQHAGFKLAPEALNAHQRPCELDLFH